MKHIKSAKLFNKEMRKLIIIVSIAILGLSTANAADYVTGVGLRVGFFSGITAKHFVKDNIAVEGLLGSRWRGVNITGLVEFHNDLPAPGFNWYYGFGGHVGFWNDRYIYKYSDNRAYTVIGIDGIIGMEYTFVGYPINISLDWKPIINLTGYSGFWADAGALSVRYTF